MGVNIFLNVEGWDSYVNGGMKQIFRDDKQFPKIYRPSGLSRDPEDYLVKFRPADFAKWRESLLQLNCNNHMWLPAMDKMEKDPSLWFSASY